MKFIWIGVGLVALFSWLAIEAGFEEDAAPILFFSLVFAMVLPFIQVKVSNHKKRAIIENAFREGCKFAHNYGDTGIAVDTKNNLLRLRDAQLWKPPYFAAYRFENIRSFEKVIFQGGEQISGAIMDASLAARLAVVSQASHAKKQNHQKSGIYVVVKDLNKPNWHVQFSNESDMNRWMEILRQCVLEGAHAD